MRLVYGARLLCSTLVCVAAGGGALSSAVAQPADLPIPAAQTTQFPAGITVRPLAGGRVYVDGEGRTLYGMDMRTVLRWSADAAQYCAMRCADWEPVLAPAGSVPNLAFPQRRMADRPPDGMIDPQKAPDWTIIAGPSGPQWVYKGWHMVYVRKDVPADPAQFDGAEDHIWNTLKFVPPVPRITAPGTVRARFVDDGYVLTDQAGAILYTGSCTAPCNGWTRFAGGAANHGVGQWRIARGGDEPQWHYRGNPVFVAATGALADIPAGATALRP